MSDQKAIDRIAKVVEKRMAQESTGHDWWHVKRVWETAKLIGANEKADMYVIELAALLHDIADWKFYDGDDTVGPRVAREILSETRVASNGIEHICDIISTMSFKGAGVHEEMRTIEGKIVQDADRLDAMGAIGIARAFAYGGSKNRQLYNPEQEPTFHKTKEEYVRGESHTINHFYEKLLLLKDQMNTNTAKEIAERRHSFMKEYLNRFFQEWSGNDS